jgi:alpha-tubulin suppressor-like RCC1 family protein
MSIVVGRGAFVAAWLVACGSEPAPHAPAAQLEPEPQEEPVAPPAPNVAGIAAGAEHTCAWTASGRVFCWGSNADGALGTSDRADLHEFPVALARLEDVVEMAAGGTTTCARSRNGRVSCFGNDFADPTASMEAPPRVIEAPSATDIAVGERHACLVTVEGGVQCWGENDRGQLGDGTTELRRGPVPVAVTDAAEVCAGEDHSCARLRDGRVLCWGLDDAGALDLSRATPVPMHTSGGYAATPTGGVAHVGITQNVMVQLAPAPTPIADAVAITCGSGFTCALLRDRRVRCFGGGPPVTGDSGGHGAASIAIDDVVELAAGGEAACARSSSGLVHCWGFGYLDGGGEQETTRTPVRVAEIEGAIAITVGSRHGCALTPRGPRCWGEVGLGQLGDGTSTAHWQILARIDATQVVSGEVHSCALDAAGSVWCWREDAIDPREDGAPYSVAEPARVGDLPAVVELWAGGRTTCARQASGAVWCWGDGERPAPVPGLDAVALGNGSNRACAVARGGDIACWSGDGMERAPGLSGATQVAAGTAHTCARSASGEITCVGENDHGQLGRHLERVRAEHLCAGYHHSCALAGGRVFCWGGATEGQLGRPGGDAAAPVRITQIEGARSLACGEFHACALNGDGLVWCWGSNDRSALGRSGEGGPPMPMGNLTRPTAVWAGARRTCVRVGEGVSCTTAQRQDERVTAAPAPVEVWLPPELRTPE